MIRIVCVWLLIVSTAVAAEPKSAAEYSSPFFDQVKRGFATWDLDHSDDLSAEEVERALANPAIKGEAAAAVASLRRAVRAHKDLAPLGLEKLAADLQTKPAKGEDAPPAYEGMYNSALERIQSASRELFPEGALNIDAVAQGRLGDCFLLASLGSTAHCATDRLKKFMRPLPDGKLQITLGDGRQFAIDAPTDGEIAIGARNREPGVWPNVYEKAIGGVLLEHSKSGKHVTPFSLIGVGGSPHTPLQILTGHKIRRHGCELYRNATDDNGASADDLDPLRADLKAAFAAGRLIVGGCGPIGKQAIVSGIYYNHSYSVLNYDATTDVVHFWNPLGNGHQPKGEPGLTHGYATSHGRFQAPLKEVVMWFGSFSIETEEAAE